MNNKNIVIVLVVLLVIAGAYYYFMNRGDDGDKFPTSADNAPPGSIHNLPVPEAVTKVKALVAEKTNTELGKVIALKVEEKEWSDSCLGKGGPEEICAQVITPGYEITVQASGREYTYRTNSDGTVIRIDD